MKQSLGLVSLVVRNYDEALGFFVGKLGFLLVEDSLVAERGRFAVSHPENLSHASRYLVQQFHCPQFLNFGRVADIDVIEHLIAAHAGRLLAKCDVDLLGRLERRDLLSILSHTPHIPRFGCSLTPVA